VEFATQYLRAGAITSYGERFGIVGRRGGFWNECRFEIELLAVAKEAGWARPRGRSTMPGWRMDGIGWNPNPLLEGRLRWRRDPTVSGPGEFGFRAHLLVVGLEMGVSLDEAVDFVAGLAGFDPYGDDSLTELDRLLVRTQGSGAGGWTLMRDHRRILELSPGEPQVSASVAALLAAGKRAEDGGDMDLAVSCYGAILRNVSSKSAVEASRRIHEDHHDQAVFLLQRGRRLFTGLPATITEESVREQAAGRMMLLEAIRMAPDSAQAEEARRLLNERRY
jgi:hypothetical protein